MFKTENNKSNFFSSKLLLPGLIIVFGILSASVAKNTFRYYEFEKEYSVRERKVENRASEREELKKLASLLETDEVAEVIARSKLGWVKEGETAVIFTDEIQSENIVSTESNTNPKKWLHFFFTPN